VLPSSHDQTSIEGDGFGGSACTPLIRGPGRTVGLRRQLGSTVAYRACTFIGRTSTVLRTTADIIDDDYGFFLSFSKTSPIRQPASPRQTSRPRVHLPHRRMLHVSLVLLQDPRA